MSHTSSTTSSAKPAPASPSKKAGGYVVTHEAVGPGWLKNRVLVAGEDFNVEAEAGGAQLDDKAIARLERLGAIRDATSDELKARADAKKAAEDAGTEFEGYSVPEPPPEEETVSAAQ